MSFARDLERLKCNIERAEDALANYLASGSYSSEEGKKLIEALGSARDEFIDRLSAGGSEVVTTGLISSSPNFREYASRVLDGYSRYSHN
jgi:hypothetical protein